MHLIRSANQQCLERLRQFLRDAHVRVDDAAELELAVSIPGAASPQHERREIDGYVRTWNALNPTCLVTLAAS
jgi:hypothetical protein